MEIIITGSVAFDYLMRFPGKFQDHILPDRLERLSLSFLVESMSRQRGGIGPNIAYTLALLGNTPRLMATVGEDFDEYRIWLESHGVDTSLVKVIPGEFTASFFVNTDETNAQIASFYPGAMGYAGQLSFQAMESDLPDLVIISPNEPIAMQQYVRECIQLDIPYLYDPSQQLARLDAENVLQGVRNARALFVNDYEFGLIQKMVALPEAEILSIPEFTVITLGEKGATVFSRQGNRWDIPAVPPQHIADPTGVGDAFRGGFLTGYSNGWSWQICGQMGSLAAAYCLESPGPQGHSFTPSEYISRFRDHFDDQGCLDLLIH